jgi:hypothetical protein
MAISAAFKMDQGAGGGGAEARLAAKKIETLNQV